MTVFASIPDKLLKEDLTDFWNQYYAKLRRDYPEAKITSSYTGDGCIEDCDVVIFLYEFRNDESTKRDIARCDELCKMYNFYVKSYVQERHEF